MRSAEERASPNSSWNRSEEHTSELQSRENIVCRLLLVVCVAVLLCFPTRRSSDLWRQGAGQVGAVRYVEDFRPSSPDGFGDELPRHARDGVLPGPVDIGDHDEVGRGEGVTELLVE